MRVSFERLLTARTIAILITGTVVFLVIFTVYFQSHTQQVLRARKEKDRYFKTAYLSPIGNKEEFKSLDYFEPDEQYRITAKMEILPPDEYVGMWSSDGKKVKFRKYAKLHFSIGDTLCSAILFEPIEKGEGNQYFLPFRDKTNGNSTYQSGRYLDVTAASKEELILDFNLAYNPYCAYNYKYSCPLAPKENKFPLKICAGEKSIK